MIKLDDIDISILSHLRDDAKTQLKDLARELKVHPNTLLQRVRKLEKAKNIKGFKFLYSRHFHPAGSYKDQDQYNRQQYEYNDNKRNFHT